MSTTNLATLDDRLSPRERLALFLAAEARGDEGEKLRLSVAAPVRLFRLPDCPSRQSGRAS